MPSMRTSRATMRASLVMIGDMTNSSFTEVATSCRIVFVRHGAGHQRDGLVHGGGARTQRAHATSVSQDDDAVRHREYLGKIVTDEHDRGASVAHFADQ